MTIYVNSLRFVFLSCLCNIWSVLLQSQHNLLQPWLLAEPESNSQHVFVTLIEVKQHRVTIWKVNFAFFVVEALLSCRSVTNQHWLTFCQDQVSELLRFVPDSLWWENLHVFPGADLPLASQIIWYISLLSYFFYIPLSKTYHDISMHSQGNVAARNNADPWVDWNNPFILQGIAIPIQ